MAEHEAPITLVDRIWSLHKARRVNRLSAAMEVCGLINVTEAGALDLLDSDVRPSDRYSKAVER